MKRKKILGLLILLGAAVVLLSVLAGVSKSEGLVPRWQHSLFEPAGVVEKEPGVGYHFKAFQGIGYQTAWTVYDSGDLNLLGFGLTHVFNIDSALDKFQYAIGLNINFGGNFGVGGGYDIIDTTSQTGLAIGKSSWADNGKLYFSIHLPINGGGLINLWRQ